MAAVVTDGVDVKGERMIRQFIREMGPMIAAACLGVGLGIWIATHNREAELEAEYERGKEERSNLTEQAKAFGFTRAGYQVVIDLSRKYNLPRDAYLAWEYSICEAFGEEYLVMLGGAIGDSTWFKQFVDGTICQECREWFEANTEMSRPFDSTDTMCVLDFDPSEVRDE